MNFVGKTYIQSLIVLFLIGFHVTHECYIIHKSIGHKKNSYKISKMMTGTIENLADESLTLSEKIT